MVKTRIFFLWQDEAEEIWLQEMSQQGWHFKSIDLFGKYSFTKGEPKSYVYRLDYQVQQETEKASYLQLFADAGWEHLQDWSGWQYFRKEVEPGQTAEIFTNTESKIAKYNRILALWILLTPTYVIYLTTIVPDHHTTFLTVISIFFTLILLLYVYVTIRVLIRIGQLKRK